MIRRLYVFRIHDVVHYSLPNHFLPFGSTIAVVSSSDMPAHRLFDTHEDIVAVFSSDSRYFDANARYIKHLAQLEDDTIREIRVPESLKGFLRGVQARGLVIGNTHLQYGGVQNEDLAHALYLAHNQDRNGAWFGPKKQRRRRRDLQQRRAERRMEHLPM